MTSVMKGCLWRTLQWWCSVLIPTQARSLNAHASFEAQPCGLLVSVQSQPFKISPVVWIRLNKWFWTILYLTKWSDWNKLHINETVPILLWHYIRSDIVQTVVKFVSVKYSLFQMLRKCFKQIEYCSNTFVERYC